TAGPLREVRPETCVVVGVSRGADVLIPDGDTRIEAGDRVLLMGPTVRADAIRGLVTPNGGRIRNVIIAGGGRTAEALLRLLLPKDRRALRVTVVEKNESRCRRLAEAFPDALVIQGDPEKPDFLREAGVEQTDAFVALLGTNHGNVMASMVAKELGAREVMATVSREEFVPLAEKAGADAVLVPRLLTVSSIVKLVRRRHVVS